MLPEFPINVIQRSEFPKLLLEIPKPPERLYVRGGLIPSGNVCLTVIGSRKGTQYGRDVTDMLIEGLFGYPMSIVSGLAIGIDPIAHEAAIRAGLHTVAFPGSGISDNYIYPPSSRGLAERILKSSGCIMSEYPPETAAKPWMFPQRNKLMAGISKATLLIEAGERSGTLITAQNAMDFNRDVLIVPGSIFSPLSVGLHGLMKDGATPISPSKDILEILGFNLL